jgi:hypothetical protein
MVGAKKIGLLSRSNIAIDDKNEIDEAPQHPRRAEGEALIQSMNREPSRGLHG